MVKQPLFLADSMLGRLAKWLRILGFDTLYQRQWSPHSISIHLADTERIFLTRNSNLFERWKNKYKTVFISCNVAPDQLEELLTKLHLSPESNTFFTRCLTCNSLLVPIPREEAENKVPEYIFINHSQFKCCPSCRKIFWPGSHPKRMLIKIEGFGITK